MTKVVPFLDVKNGVYLHIIMHLKSRFPCFPEPATFFGFSTQNLVENVNAINLSCKGGIMCMFGEDLF